MDWKTIRVLTKNLEELLAQYERGEHIVALNNDRHLRDAWWVGIRSLTAALAGQFNMVDQ